MNTIFRPVFRRLVILCVFLGISCGSSSASGTGVGYNASVSISVTNENNEPLGESRVQLLLHGQVVTRALTDRTGKATIVVPAAGSYVLAVDKKGYIAAESALEMRSDSGTAEIEVSLSHIALSRQEVTVQGNSSNPVNEESSTPATLAPTQAKLTPSRPATLTDVLPLIPGVVRANNGSLGIAGYGESHSTLLVNSVDVTDPSTGDFGLSVPIDSVETISVSEMPYLAQYGRFIAGVVTAETRPGGEKWSSSLNDPLPEFRIRSGHLVGLKTASPRLNLSGPLIRRRLYISEGAEYLLDKQSVRTLPFPLNETRSTAINSFTQLDTILSPAQTLTASFHFAPHSQYYAGLDYFNPQPVTPTASFHESTGTVIHRLSLGGGVLQSTIALIRIGSGIQPQGPADMVLGPSGNQGNYFSQQSRGATRLEWLENWMPRTLHFAGEHSLQIGYVLGHTEDEGTFRARPVHIQDASGHTVQRIDFVGGKPFGLSDYEPAAYLQDHWVVNSHFALDVGARFEGQTITSTTRTAPRGGLVWSPTADRRTIVRGGAGIFYDSVPLSTYAFRSYPEQVVTSYGSSGAVTAPPLHYINVTQEALRSGFSLVDRFPRAGNFAPYSVAWNFELERQINRIATVRAKYLQSWARDMITLQPETVQGQNALVLGSSGSAQTRQFEFTVKIGSEARRQFFFSYVRQHAQGSLSDGSRYLGNYPFPVIRPSVFASLPNEIPNRFLLWGVMALPGKIQLNPHIEYRNGFPYQPTNVVQQYVLLSAGPQYRFPRYFAFDALASKDFQITKKHAVRFSLSMLNITNHFNPLEVHSNTADPQYGRFFGNYPRRFLVDFDFLY